jgi:hypothetical protein
MALGALIGAYQEDDQGGLRALLPLAGRTLLEYQVRCAAAAGAAPIILIVERMPQALQDAVEMFRGDGIGVFPVNDLSEAVSRFEAGSPILLIGDGIAPPASLVAQLADEGENAVAAVPDNAENAAFERIDNHWRWSGVAVVDAHLLGSTAAMVGDWDIQSTLLRRAIQEGALKVPVSADSEPLLVERADQLDQFQRTLVSGSRVARSDWASRFFLPLAEDFATEQLMETRVRPAWLLWAALALTVAATICILRGWLGAALGLLVVSAPLDLVANRLAMIRLRPLNAKGWAQRMLWPAAGLALIALGWWESHAGTAWGALITAGSAAAFAAAARIEQAAIRSDYEIWLFSRRNAIFLAIPFAVAGSWTAYLIVTLLYAAISFFLLQHVRHQQPS